MGVAAAGTALSAYLLGTMTNQAYVERNFHDIVIIGLMAMVIFAAKGVATYGATVMLSRIGNRIVANNQRRMFDKLLARRHGFLRRPSFVGIHRAAHHRRQRGKPGHQSPHHRDRPRSAVGHRADDRDGDAGPGDVARRLRRRAAGVPGAAQTGATRARHRADPVHRWHAHHRDDAGSAAGHAHGQGVLARGRDAASAWRQRRRRRAGIEQDGARFRTAPAR